MGLLIVHQFQKIFKQLHMHLVLQLIIQVVDSQELLRNLLLVLQILDYCQLSVSIFLPLGTGSVVHRNSSVNNINISKEIHP